MMSRHFPLVVRAILFTLLITFFCLFIYLYISSEKTIYFWDYILYWHKYIQGSKAVSNNILQYFGSLWHSIHIETYNDLPVVPLIPFSFLFGTSRLSYIFSIVIIFLIPGFIGLLYVLYALSKSKSLPPITLLSFISLFVLYFFSVDIVGPMVRGYLDVGGLGLIFLLLALYFKSVWTIKLNKHSFFSAIIIGLLSASIVIFRRYFIYFTIGFFASIPLIEITAIWTKSGVGRIKHIKSWCVHYGIVLFSSILTFLLLTGDMYKSFIFIATHDIYSAWKEDLTIPLAILRTISEFGLINFLFWYISLLFLLLYSHHKKNILILFSTIVISSLLFWNTQYFDYQHYYLIVGPIIIIQAIGLLYALKSKWRLVICGVFVSFCFVNAYFTFTSAGKNKITYGSISLLSGKNLPPLVRHDIDQMKKVISQLSLVWQPNETIYIGASSTLFSDDIVRNLCYEMYSFDTPLCKSIQVSSHIDARDGYPQKILTSTYIIVTDPIQYHKLPEYQHTITYVSEFINANYENYQLNFENIIEDGIKIRTYKNIIPIHKQQIEDWNNF
jgi:hypothetical protein